MTELADVPGTPKGRVGRLIAELLGEAAMAGVLTGLIAFVLGGFLRMSEAFESYNAIWTPVLIAVTVFVLMLVEVTVVALFDRRSRREFIRTGQDYLKVRSAGAAAAVFAAEQVAAFLGIALVLAWTLGETAPVITGTVVIGGVLFCVMGIFGLLARRSTLGNN